MIITKTTVVYDPSTKEVLGEFQPGTDLYPGEGMETFEASLDDFLKENPDYTYTTA